MLVMSRMIGESIAIKEGHTHCLVTVVGIEAGDGFASFNFTLTPASGERISRKVRLAVNESFNIENFAEIKLIDFPQGKARFGINAARTTSVHRSDVVGRG